MSVDPATAAEPARPFWHFRLAIPDRLRALVRGSEVWLVVLAAIVGLIAGCVVVIMNLSVAILHGLLFGIAAGERLSAVEALPSDIGFVVPVVGGLIMVAGGLALARARFKRPVDPIEANALHGGRMSLRDSVIVALQTIVSNGFGASVGLEAGYSQMVAGIASRLGISFRLRRADLRVLVGCGAASAIAAAFNAPLTGAFYGFELIIGTYTASAPRARADSLHHRNSGHARARPRGLFDHGRTALARSAASTCRSCSCWRSSAAASAF